MAESPDGGEMGDSPDGVERNTVSGPEGFPSHYSSVVDRPSVRRKTSSVTLMCGMNSRECPITSGTEIVPLRLPPSRVGRGRPGPSKEVTVNPKNRSHH